MVSTTASRGARTRRRTPISRRASSRRSRTVASAADRGIVPPARWATPNLTERRRRSGITVSQSRVGRLRVADRSRRHRLSAISCQFPVVASEPSAPGARVSERQSNLGSPAGARTTARVRNHSAASDTPLLRREKRSGPDRWRNAMAMARLLSLSVTQASRGRTLSCKAALARAEAAVSWHLITDN